MTVQGTVGMSSQVRRNLQSYNRNNANEFYASLMNTQAHMAENANIWTGTSAFPAIVLHKPIKGYVTPGDISALGLGTDFSSLTGKEEKEILAFRARCIGFSDRPSPDDCLELPENFDIFDPATVQIIESHPLYYWLGDGELPNLNVGDIIMVQFDDMTNMENGYATKIIEKTDNPGLPDRWWNGGSSITDRVGSLFDASGDVPFGAPDVLAAGESGPACRTPSGELLVTAEAAAAQLCKWTGPYPLMGGDRKTKFNAVIINNILIEEKLAPYVVILLTAMRADGIQTEGLFNSGFRPTWAGDVGPKDSFRSPVGLITIEDMKSNVVGKDCKDWDGSSPAIPPRKNQSSQQKLYWQNCYGTGNSKMGATPTNNKGKRWADENDYGCKPSTNSPKMRIQRGHLDGTAIDMNTGKIPTSTVYKWMMDNAYKYGFRRTVKSERWHWEFRPGESMFAGVAKTHETWNNYFTSAAARASLVAVVPADSPITKPEDLEDL